MSSLALVGDIGGTNARFALVEENSLELLHLQRLSCADYPTILEAIESYLSSLALTKAPTRGCLAIAGPITGDRINMTNNPWDFSLHALQSALGMESLQAINDFIAIAHAVPTLEEKQWFSIGGGEVVEGMPVAVLGPGTGLGVAGLVPAGERWIPFATEGGHVDFAPADGTEMWILRLFQQEFEHVSAERLLCGPGLEALYRAVASLRDQNAEELNAATITERALEGSDSLCEESLKLFCGMLGSFAGNVALTMGSLGGVALAGGMLPRFLDFLQQSNFRERFEAKGCYREYMATIPTRVILAEEPGLRGAAAALQQA